MSTEKPPCPEYNTDAELLKDFLEKLDKAYTCLLFICYRKIIPSLKRKNFQIEKDVEDIVMNALTEVVMKTEVYGSLKKLLWTVSSMRLIDWIRRFSSYDADGEVIVRENTTDNWGVFESLFVQADPILDIEFEDEFRSFRTTLNEREELLLRLLSEGKTEEMIATMMDLKPGYVDNLKSSVKRSYLKFFDVRK
ncbi:hypothetical protein MUK70_15175 [Dyadobacter chenwenxiniae]|uniref:Uncharacterized protein n=1 Tax=Dyadobacter chenwenxiniae TaxID=2906456 RepID=A0A9X1PII6_9BACT|nr:hypothetical protein [Dyadobacter chenwenxiniae]MCF0060584.1 hypothetical protein [Dyadobacter chenwenxiniae]UON86315.1 hypothetical protein MUK70_15175 [Dyadobacter chenwenxiniae]